MLTWLKKYGLTILKDAAIVLGIGSQVVSQVAPASAGATKVSDTLTNIATIVTDVETSSAAVAANGGTMTSAQKLAAATALVNQTMQQWFTLNMPGTPSVQNQQAWENGIALVTNGVVAILNSAQPNVATAPAAVKGSAPPSAATLSAVVAAPAAPTS
jgi:hypothetical protein